MPRVIPDLPPQRPAEHSGGELINPTSRVRSMAGRRGYLTLTLATPAPVRSTLSALRSGFNDDAH
jgi:hypothetical protein